MFFIATERYSDFNSMIEQYEQEMRRIFAEKQKIADSITDESESIRQVLNVTDENETNNLIGIPQETQEAPLKEGTTDSRIISDGVGNIIVEVTTARGAIPMEGTDVVIDRLDGNDENGRQELIAVETTNQSGRTRPVSVNTVSKELSLVPGNSEPFSTFYVTAAVMGFEPVKSRPVDVFANEISILKIDLIPKPEHLSGGDFANG